MRLEPGSTAVSEITFSPPAAGGAGAGAPWTPTDAVVTPPDETRSETIPWTFGPVSRQDGATHPGTYFGPVTPN